MSRLKPSLIETDIFFQLPKEAQQVLGRYAQQRGWVWADGRWNDSLERSPTDAQPFLPIDISDIARAIVIRAREAGIRVLDCGMSLIEPYSMSVLIDLKQPYCIVGPTPRYVALAMLKAIHELIATGEWKENTEVLGKAEPKETLKP